MPAGNSERWHFGAGGLSMRPMSDSTASDDNARWWARVALGAVLVVLALAGLSTLNAPTPCGDLRDGYPAIIAFELARDATSLAAIFGTEAGACRDAMIAAMDVTNYVDLGLFMPAYGLFLLAALRMLAEDRRAANASTALIVAIMLGDAAENACLLALTPDLDASSTALAALPWITGLKWSLLGAASVVAARDLWRRSTAHKVGAALSLSAPVLVVLALADPHAFGHLISLGITISWVVLLLTAAATVRQRPSGSNASHVAANASP